MAQDVIPRDILPKELQNLDSFQLISLNKSHITVGSLITGVIIVILTFVLARLAVAAFRRWRSRLDDQNAPSVYIFEKLVSYGIIIVGLTMGLTALGLNLSSFTLFAGALGVGLGFGLQGLVKEFMSGLVILFDRMIRIGEYVELQSGQRGIIQEISPRATRIRNNDDVDVLIPNSQLIEGVVANWTLRGKTRRFHIPFTVAYGTDKAAVRDAVLKAAHEVSFTQPDNDRQKTQVWLVGFGDHGLKFELVVWPNLEAVKRPNALHAAYTWAIEDALRAGGFEIPLQQIDLRLRALFGEEGKAALTTLNLKPAKPAPVAEAPASHNDAADDVLLPIEAPEPTPPLSKS